MHKAVVVQNLIWQMAHMCKNQTTLLNYKIGVAAFVQSGTETRNQIFNWKKLGFFRTIFLKNLHASTYII